MVVVAPMREKCRFSSYELLTALSKFMWIVRVFLFQLEDCRDRASVRLVRVGTEDAGGTGLITMVAVTVFEFWSLAKDCDEMTYPASDIQMLGGEVLSQVKPVSVVQVPEQPSPPRIFPSSHCLEVVLGSCPFPHIYTQVAVALTALKKLGHTHWELERILSSGLLVVEQEVQVVDEF